MSRDTDRMTIGQFLARTFDIVLDPAPLLFCALVGLILSVGLNLLDSRVFLVPAIFMIVYSTSALTKYTTMLTRAVALGHPVPAASDVVFDYLRHYWAFAPWVALLLLGALGYLVNETLGSVGLWLFLALTLPVVPAAIAVICLTSNLLTLFRYRELLRVIRLLGWDYVKVLAGWAVMIGVGALLPGYGYPTVLVLCLQLLYLFSSVGVVLYHHHQAVGVPVERLPKDERLRQRAEQALNRERQQVLDEAYGYFSRGNEIGGLRRLQSYLEQSSGDDTWDWFIDRMRGWETRRPFLLLARNYLTRLVEHDRDARAVELLLACMQLDPDFAPLPEVRATLRAKLDGHPFAERAARWR